MERIMVVQTQSMFGEGVQRLLSGATDLEVIVVTAGDQDELVEAIQRIGPKVVILTRGMIKPDDASGLVTSLSDYPRLRVIVMSDTDNLVHIYDKQQVTVTEVADLYGLIHHS